MRDFAELKGRVIYVTRVNELHGRLFRRSKMLCDGTIVLAGALALSGVSTAFPWYSQAAGAVTAIFGVVSMLLDPGAKALAHEMAQRRWEALATRVSKEKPNPEVLETWGNELSESDPPQLDSLRIKAYNDYCDQIGAASQRIRWPLSLWFIAPLI
jgi:hypothetical protein